jgi:hypothetical protein
MRERPILFSAPMVRAILEGRKTQTRRVVKPQPEYDGDYFGGFTDSVNKRGAISGGYVLKTKKATTSIASFNLGAYSDMSPYGKPGDRLWVREAFAEEIEFHGSEMPYSDGRPKLIHAPVDELDEEPTWRQCHYRATDESPDLQCLHKKCEGGPCMSPWKPSIHMPRWASRITLEITDVRVERLQDISCNDLLAEGSPVCIREYSDRTIGCVGAREWYRTLWDSINGEGAWDKNPWVWAVSFRRVEVLK